TKYRAVVQNGVCGEKTSEEATITVDALSVGGKIVAKETTNQTYVLVCHQADGNSIIPLVLSGHTGQVLRWEYLTQEDNTWIPVNNTTTEEAGYDKITISRIYRAIIK